MLSYHTVLCTNEHATSRWLPASVLAQRLLVRHIGYSVPGSDTHQQSAQPTIGQPTRELGFCLPGTPSVSRPAREAPRQAPPARAVGLIYKYSAAPLAGGP